MSQVKRRMGLWSGLEPGILGSILTLMGIGIIMSFAASPAMSPSYDEWYYLKRQIGFSVIGLAIIAVTAALSPAGIRRMAGLALLGSYVALVLVLLFGPQINGSTRWLRFGGFSLQPSEFFKPAFIVFIAWLFTEEDRGAPVPGRIIGFGLYAMVVLLLMLQTDFGQTVLISLIFGTLLWASGLSWRYAGILFGLGAGGAGLVYTSVPYIRDRIAQFLSPASDIATRNQTDFALDAIARGGLFGAGPGEGEIKHSLPEAHTDFVFSVAAEEFGLVASLLIILINAMLFIRAWMQSLRLTDPFNQLATVGLALLFGLQALVNIAVNLKIAPPTGMTLPFISYGGSSILALAFSAGLLLALTRRRPGAYRPARQTVLA